MIKDLLINDVVFYLLPDRAIFIPAYKTLIISDWHIGKLTHFRNQGLLIPPIPSHDEFKELANLIHHYIPRKVVFLGDLFHAEWNEDWEQLNDFLTDYPHIEFVLTQGNHDILAKEIMDSSVVKMQNSYYLNEEIVLSHDVDKRLPDHYFQVVGHLHPGYVIRSRGRQVYRLPCFHLTENRLTMPAFGKWTGLQIVEKNNNDRVFVILGDQVAEV